MQNTSTVAVPADASEQAENIKHAVAKHFGDELAKRLPSMMKVTVSAGGMIEITPTRATPSEAKGG